MAKMQDLARVVITDPKALKAALEAAISKKPESEPESEKEASKPTFKKAPKGERITVAPKPDKKITVKKSGPYRWTMIKVPNKISAKVTTICVPQVKKTFIKNTLPKVQRVRYVEVENILSVPIQINKRTFNVEDHYALMFKSLNEGTSFDLRLSMHLVNFLLNGEMDAFEKTHCHIVLFADNGHRYLTVMKNNEFLPVVDFYYPLASLQAKQTQSKKLVEYRAIFPLKREGKGPNNHKNFLYGLFGKNLVEKLSLTMIGMKFSNPKSFVKFGTKNAIRLTNQEPNDNTVCW